jgi:hypothetical protein
MGIKITLEWACLRVNKKNHHGVITEMVLHLSIVLLTSTKSSRFFPHRENRMLILIQTNNNLSNSRKTVRTPTNITTGTNILKLDPGIYSYEDSNASDEQKLAMGFPKAMWHSEITVTGYWADNNKSTGYINIVVRDCNGDTPCIYENLYGWTGWRGWQSYALKSDSLRLSQTYISGDSYADAKDLSIPPGIYSVGPGYKNIPETTYGFLEIVADSNNNWRLIKFIPTNIKSHYLMFYNGYDKTWSEWTHFTSVS